LNIVDVGNGPPIVIIPGVQGRWEWMKPGIDALANRCRVVTFSLADEPSCEGHFDPSHGFDSYVDQVTRAMDQAGLSTAVIAGVSYGGLVAAAFAARHPQRAAGLVLVSAIPPQWTPNARVRLYLKAPRLLFPLFMLGSLRMYREIATASPGVIRSMAVATRQGFTVLTHMFSPGRVAGRVHALAAVQLDREVSALHMPTLVVTGEPGLDVVVPVHLTDEYTHMWPHAERVTIEHTGHLGLVTRPETFADAVAQFIDRIFRLKAEATDRGKMAEAATSRVGEERRVG
jgi:pimeloyl-ACP methyl ester carboxylesterase